MVANGAASARRCYSIERLLRGSRSRLLSLSSLSLSPLCVSPSLSSSLSFLLSRSLFVRLLFSLSLSLSFSLSHPSFVFSWSSSSSTSSSSPISLPSLFPGSLLSLPSLCLSFRVSCCSLCPSLVFRAFYLPRLSLFLFLSSSRNPTMSSLHDLVVGWRPSLVLPTSTSSSSVPVLLFGPHLMSWRWEEGEEEEASLGNLSPSETIRESAAEIRSGVRWSLLYPLINIRP